MKVKYLSILFATILGGVLMTGAVSATDALTWQDEVDVQFTFNPALSISLSAADIVIEDLSPNTSADSNQISVTVKTNNVSGYQLNATVGDASHAYRTLLHTNGTNSFASIDVGSSMTTLPEGNYWGYSANDGVTFSGLPLYSDTENVAVLNSSDGAITEITPFRIKARAAATQTAGDYSNVINFVAVTNAVPEPAVDYCAQNGIADANCMQKMVAGDCTTTAKTVMDLRDGEQYKVQRLADGKCWMLDNLRLDLVATDQATLQGNTNASSQTLDYLKNEGGRSAGDQYATAGVSYWTSSYSYSAPLIAIKDASDTEGTGWNPNTTTTSYGDGSGKIGVYYNFCAASAGSYCYGNGTSAGTSVGDAGEDICPAGWRMPTGGANTVTTDGKGEYQALATAITGNTGSYISGTAVQTALSSPLSGRFYDGSASGQGSLGIFWSSTRYSDYNMYYLSVYSSGVAPQNGGNRYYGTSVRCLLQ